MFTDLMKSGTFSPVCSHGIMEASAWVSVNPHRSRQLSLENFWPVKRIFCLYYRFQVSELCCFLSPLWKKGKKKNKPLFLPPSEPKKMALTESLCTQNIRASGHAPLAQASGTVQIAAYPTSRMACLTPPLHRSITVWTIWPSPTTTGTPIDTPATGTSGTEADLWVRLKDLFNSPKVVCSKTCILTAQLNFRLEICDGVKILLPDLESPLWENFVGVNISFNSCVFSYLWSLWPPGIYLFIFPKGVYLLTPDRSTVLTNTN